MLAILGVLSEEELRTKLHVHLVQSCAALRAACLPLDCGAYAWLRLCTANAQALEGGICLSACLQARGTAPRLASSFLFHEHVS